MRSFQVRQRQTTISLLGQLPFTGIIHQNGIANANVCAVVSGGDMNGENTSGENIIGVIILIKTK